MTFLERLRDHLERLPEPVAQPLVLAPPHEREDEQRLDVKRYAFETRLSRRRDREMVLARAGRILLSLPGRDAVAWLLAMEMAQAQSDKDPFRLSVTAAREILSRGEWFIDHGGPSSGGRRARRSRPPLPRSTRP